MISEQRCIKKIREYFIREHGPSSQWSELNHLFYSRMIGMVYLALEVETDESSTLSNAARKRKDIRADHRIMSKAGMRDSEAYRELKKHYYVGDRTITRALMEDEP